MATLEVGAPTASALCKAHLRLRFSAKQHIYWHKKAGMFFEAPILLCSASLLETKCEIMTPQMGQIGLCDLSGL